MIEWTEAIKVYGNKTICNWLSAWHNTHWATVYLVEKTHKLARRKVSMLLQLSAAVLRSGLVSNPQQLINS